MSKVRTQAEHKSLFHSLARGTPFGDTARVGKTAAMLGLESSLSIERPAKVPV
ncbi:MAG: hypothetical protein RLZZ458_2976 [Planctomycetota bacterium]|jgi:hypothetical protein